MLIQLRKLKQLLVSLVKKNICCQNSIFHCTSSAKTFLRPLNLKHRQSKAFFLAGFTGEHGGTKTDSVYSWNMDILSTQQKVKTAVTRGKPCAHAYLSPKPPQRRHSYFHATSRGGNLTPGTSAFCHHFSLQGYFLWSETWRAPLRGLADIDSPYYSHYDSFK